MPAFASVAHPTSWSRAVVPADVSSGRLMVVGEAAVAAGVRATALLEVDPGEIGRRQDAGCGALLSLPLLDVLLGLPLGCAIRRHDLSAREQRILATAPRGSVHATPKDVCRLATVPLTVAASVVVATTWRTALRRTTAFAPFAQRIVILPRLPRDLVLWEAELTGVGIWIGAGAGDRCLTEVVAPAPFVRRYHQPAGWRFAERAYAVLARTGRQEEAVNARSRRVPWTFPEDRPAPEASEG